MSTDRQGEDEEFVAHDWLTNVFEPTIRAIPREMRGKLEPAEAFHEVLEHRWYLSQQQDRDVPLSEAVPSYLDTVLRHRPDEVAVLGLDTATLRALDEDDGDRLIG